MAGLHLPLSVVVAEANRRMEEQADAHLEESRHWSAELKRIDPHLELVWVPEEATEPMLVPARWHIRKRIPGDVDAYIPLVGPGNTYRPPGGWILDFLESADMWNPRVHRSRQEAKDRLREVRRRARAREAEQRQDEIVAGYRAGMRLRGDAGMTMRTDLKRPKKIAEERAAKLEAEGIKAKR